MRVSNNKNCLKVEEWNQTQHLEQQKLGQNVINNTSAVSKRTILCHSVTFCRCVTT